MKSIKLCADDFGLNEPVNKAILRLIKKNRLNAVSCMATMANLEPYSDQLLAAISNTPHETEIGLHLTFTEYKSLTNIQSLEKNQKLPEIGELLIHSHLRKLNYKEIENEVRAQFERFETVFGKKPDFIDGHQHVHILPVIRDAVLNVSKDYLNKNGWVRVCYQPVSCIMKNRISLLRTLLISRLSKPLRKQLRTTTLNSNNLFLGINKFDQKDDYRKQMQAWLKLAAQYSGNTLIMCHPGLAPDISNTINDPIKNRRPDEFQYLFSDDFIKDLSSNNLTL